MAKTYRIAIPLLALWLLGWIALSWPAIQDDALIHLRYADNLVRCHFITYDGVHPDYGASSLLYVALLAGLRMVSGSANLARAVSSGMHLLLFAGLAWGLWTRGARWTSTARLAAVTLLVLVVMPGAVRWLDDGMETGIAAGAAVLLAWLIHDEYVRVSKGDPAGGVIRFWGMAVLGFFCVLLRTELALVCGVGLLLLASARPRGTPAGRSWRVLGASSHLPLGALVAIGFIFATMHTLLPDTAKAKSHGIAHWFNPIQDTAVTLGGAMSFGAGMLVFWLVTLALVILRERRLTLTTVLANCFFPLVLALASLRGQEIQGARYFAWTFFFATVWNILELGGMEAGDAIGTGGRWLLYGLLILLAAELPFESAAMHRVLTRRAATMREFEGQHLELLRGGRGIASDIGYIGYFTGAKLCDLAGLVNGRAAASLTSGERTEACAGSDPEFLFVNVSQLGPLAHYRDYSQWQVCGRYDFTNVSTPDSHYLIVRPEAAASVCRATGQGARPLGSLTVR
jgi:hypothetical protein